jgi:hypothetical protein
MKKIIILLLLVFVTGACYADDSGYLNIINQSSYPIVKNSESVTGLNAWNLPRQVGAGSQQSSYVEYNGNIFRTFLELDLNDNGETTYFITCPNNNIDQIKISAGMIKNSSGSGGSKISYEYYIDNIKSSCVMGAFTSSNQFVAAQSRTFLFNGTVNLYIMNK